MNARGKSTIGALLSVPGELEAQTRDELERHHLPHHELDLKSFTASAVFYLVSAAFQDTPNLAAFCQALAAHARTHRQQASTRPTTQLRASDNEHITLTLTDGTRIDPENIGQAELHEILSRYQRDATDDGPT